MGLAANRFNPHDTGIPVGMPPQLSQYLRINRNDRFAVHLDRLDMKSGSFHVLHRGYDGFLKRVMCLVEFRVQPIVVGADRGVIAAGVRCAR